RRRREEHFLTIIDLPAVSSVRHQSEAATDQYDWSGMSYDGASVSHRAKFPDEPWIVIEAVA
ncbi:MAG TPA: hypothetical protein VFE22_08875, partial [Edaphobacter sp.]|nr:hypothetical protein [Edaphobacter sp.]